MALYPAFLELSGSPVLVVGGGAVAHQKVKALAQAGAKIHLVSPRLTAPLARLVQSKKIRWSRRKFQLSDLKPAQLVVVGTSDSATNGKISQAAKKRNLWVNVVDQPKLCSFIVPSVVRRGRLTLAISTSGASPALAKWIRQDLQRRYGPEFKRLTRTMALARGRVQKKVKSPKQRQQLFEKALKAYMKVLEE